MREELVSIYSFLCAHSFIGQLPSTYDACATVLGSDENEPKPYSQGVYILGDQNKQ